MASISAQPMEVVPSISASNTSDFHQCADAQDRIFSETRENLSILSLSPNVIHAATRATATGTWFNVK